MLSPHMRRENAFRLKPCLPVTSTQEVEECLRIGRAAFLVVSTAL